MFKNSHVSKPTVISHKKQWRAGGFNFQKLTGVHWQDFPSQSELCKHRCSNQKCTSDRAWGPAHQRKTYACVYMYVKSVQCHRALVASEIRTQQTQTAHQRKHMHAYIYCGGGRELGLSSRFYTNGLQNIS